MILITFDFGSSTNHDTSSTCFICILHTLDAINSSTCREIWSRDILHQFIEFDIRIINIRTATIDDLTQIMCRNIRSHTYSDTVTTINKEIRNLSRHYRRLLQSIIEVVDHIDGFLIKVVHNMFTHLTESALRITHSSRRVTIHRTEVTLTINKFITHIPFLTHTNQSAINRRVTMRVVFTKHLTYNTSTLLVRFITSISNTQHTVEDTTMHRFETIANIWKGTSYNYRHRIVDIRALHLFFDVDFQNSIIIDRLIFIHFLMMYFIYISRLRPFIFVLSDFKVQKTWQRYNIYSIYKSL